MQSICQTKTKDKLRLKYKCIKEIANFFISLEKFVKRQFCHKIITAVTFLSVLNKKGTRKKQVPKSYFVQL
jgi:hypothetical protein